MNFASYPFASTSILAPLEAVQFVTNVLLGKALFGKIVTSKMWIGTFGAIFGTVFALLNAPSEKPAEEMPKNNLDFVELWK